MPGPLVPWEDGQALGHTHFCSAWIPRVAVETLGIPCFLAGMARGLLGRNHPLHFQQNRRAALKKADVVVLAGAVCHFRLSYGCVLSCSSKIIVVLINSDIFWKPQEAVQGDVGSLW